MQGATSPVRSLRGQLGPNVPQNLKPPKYPSIAVNDDTSTALTKSSPKTVTSSRGSFYMFPFIFVHMF